MNAFYVVGAVVAGSALMGVAGAFLTLSAFDAFFFNMVNGRGWICIAIVVFGSWRPGKALLGTLLFAAFDAILGATRAYLDGIFSDRVFLVSFLSNVVIAGLIVFVGDQIGVGSQLSTGVVVVLGIRIFTNAAAIRRALLHA